MSRRARSDLALVQQLRGRLDVAAGQYEMLLNELGEMPLFEGMEQRMRLATVYVEWDDLELAEALLRRALELTHALHTSAYARIYLVLARLLCARGDLDGATSALDGAHRGAQQMGNFPQLSAVEAQLARTRLRRGDLAAAVRWADTLDGAADLDTFEREPEALVKARVDLARGHLVEASALLRRMLQRAECAGQANSALAILTLSAITHDARHDRAAALGSLRLAFERGRIGGYRRVFLDEGVAIVPLLRQLGGHAADLASSIAPGGSAATGALLSAREQEVLRLLARGLSNREIAESLVVSRDTIKTHLRNIGVKLGASTRTQVLARARAAGGLLD